MKSNSLQPAARRKAVKWAGMALLAAGLGALSLALADGQLRLPEHFAGLLSDYTPAVSGGPYEMRGKWSLHVNDERGTATFAAEIAMETAGFANSDPNHDPTKLNAHTHHISVTDGRIHNDPADPINWTASCPGFKPAATRGFVITGTAYVTGNGGNAPFGNPSAVTMCVLGGAPNPNAAGPQASVEFSNFTLMFDKGSLASGHFGTQAINGVVVGCGGDWNRDSGGCRVAVSQQ